MKFSVISILAVAFLTVGPAGAIPIDSIQDQTTATTYYPIPIRSLFIGSKIHGNFDAKDSNAISWMYPDNYSDNLAIVAPEFNPLTDLIPAA